MNGELIIKHYVNLHVIYALAAKKSKCFVQQLVSESIVVLVASPSCLIKHAFSKSVMSAERNIYYNVL